MRLTALVDHPEHVCCRYRLAALRPFLQSAGHVLDFRLWPRRWWEWFLLGRQLRDSDAVILQRKLLQGWQLHLLRRAAQLLFYDFDDAIFLRDSYSPKGLHSRLRLRRFAATCRAADAVLAGNAYLAQEAKHWTSPDKIHVVPTCVDPSYYLAAKAARSDIGATVQVVWVGSQSTLKGLEPIKPTLEELGRRESNLRLKLVCDRYFKLDNLMVLPCAWTQAGEAAEIAAADIGVSWIPDDLWSQGKCGLKLLQYMAAGLPVVANDVGVHREIVNHGETGFLVRTPDEWCDAVLTLARSPSLRRSMGIMGRRRIEAKFSVKVGAEQWLKLLGRQPQGAAA